MNSPSAHVQRRLAHGFAQTGGCLGPVADALVDHTVLRPDLPGHGGAAALADLDLTAIGDDAQRWLGIAQAFAGPPGAGR